MAKSEIEEALRLHPTSIKCLQYKSMQETMMGDLCQAMVTLYRIDALSLPALELTQKIKTSIAKSISVIQP